MIKHQERLKGVHPDLVLVIKEAGEHADFIITQGLRTIDEQLKLVNAGRSMTVRSRHLTGHAVDVALIVNGTVSWDFEDYKKFSVIVKKIAFDHDVPIVWGGDWKTLRDGPHFELERSRYPA